jgi:hypothetical protein
MIPALRERFNRSFDPAAARRIRARIAATTGEEITFPLSMSPVFIAPQLARRLCEAVLAFFACIRRADYRREAATWVPERYRAGGEPGDIPRISQFDFALSSGPDGEIRPLLLECQGFSSLMGVVPWFGHLLCSQMIEGCTPWLSYGSWEDYRSHLAAVVGGSVLVDVETSRQRLRTDFWVLRQLAGVEVADLDWTTLRRLDGAGRRVYSRVVPVEAETSGYEEVFQAFCRQPRDWVSSPDWFFLLGKRALRRLSEVSDLVPETVDLTPETAREWAGRTDFVLKPANDFGGHGVNLEPAPRDLEAALRGGEPHVLQVKATLAPVVQPPDGPPLFCDLRVLCLDERPVSLLCRLARDRMCNIAHNRQFPWCGITVGLLPAGPQPAVCGSETAA